jgi:hypothetical protein
MDDVVADTYVGVNQVSVLSSRTRRVVVIGEGRDAPVSPAGPAIENIGVEHDCALLAIGPRTLAGHGCVLQLRIGLEDPPELLETVSGYEVLRVMPSLRIRFAPPRAASTLVLTVAAVTRDSGVALQEIRWRAVDAVLKGLNTIIDSQRTAFVMSIEASRAWSLDIDLGRAWRLQGAVLCVGSPRELIGRLRSRQDWDLVDDRFDQPPSGTTSTVTLEVAQ